MIQLLLFALVGCALVGGENIPQEFCSSTSNLKTLKYYTSRFGTPSPATFDPVTDEIGVSYPIETSVEYQYEGSRYVDGNCTACRYSDEYVMEAYFDGGVRAVNAPMYGPCIDGERSIKVACVQNMLLYPIQFVGEYYYPDQRPHEIGNGFFSHAWLQDLDFSKFARNRGSLDPSAYGLGREAVIADLLTMRVDEDAALESQIRAPYVGSGWLKWAQHFCTNACHRDALYQHVTVRDVDFRNKGPTLALLNRGPNTTVPRCAKCPPYQSGYRWGSLTSPFKAAEPSLSLIGRDCFPWFGSVPVLIESGSGSGAKSLNTTHKVDHSFAVDGVVFPPDNRYYQAIPCPVDTYNDECAHSFLFSAVPAACKPCPVGYHTGGMRGAWFCLPPPGDTILLNPSGPDPIRSTLRNLINMHRDPATNMSLLWSRRDLLGYDFECGSKSADCYQCSKFKMSADAVPSDFNRKFIFERIFVWQRCPSGYYCPAALQPPIRCPSPTTWSPAGSHTIANCACPRGYYAASAATCVQCPDRLTTCPRGHFLSGWTRCAEMDGAVSGGVCAQCGNLPPSAARYTNQSGVEVLDMANAAGFRGACPFVCDAGMRLVGAWPGYQCLPLVMNGFYSPELTPLRDSYVVTPSIGAALRLSNTRLTYMHAVSTSCVQANPSACDSAACVVTRNSTYDSDNACEPCAGVRNLPSSAVYMYGETIETSHTCRVRCKSPGHYFNKTSWTCMSCADYGCPDGHQATGGGCYGNFSSSEPSACVRCIIPLPQQGTNTWLSLEKCEYMECNANVPPNNYIHTACGGIGDTDVRPCTLSCPPGKFLTGTCQPRATGVCNACKLYAPGSYMIGNCTSTSDSVWAQCLPGSFCAGDGTIARCPGNQTSVPGASSDVHCFCPVGFIALHGVRCVPYQCPPSASATAMIAPGASYFSRYYMQHDADRTTICVLCPENSFSILNAGVGAQSCVCSASAAFSANDAAHYNGYYYSNGSACLPCASGGCRSCWRGGTCTTAAACPPFVASCQTSTGSSVACAAGFVYAADGSRSTAEQGVSGSSLYGALSGS